MGREHMTMTGLRLIIAGVFLAGCGGGLMPQEPQKSIPVLHLAAGKKPPQADGTCWASDTTPAVIETITEQLLVKPELRDTTGKVTSPAQFETKTVQRLVQDREMVWFTAPCPADMTVDFIASLQRALKARGQYFNVVTGVYDQATGDAVRKLQAERGLDSPVLAMATAQDLGLAAEAPKGL